MSNLIAELVPLNLLEEKAKFFADQTYHPQFQYVREFSRQELTIWGLPKNELAEYSRKMLETSEYQVDKGEIVTREYIVQEVERFNVVG